jgi:hypothetical protein
MTRNLLPLSLRIKLEDRSQVPVLTPQPQLQTKRLNLENPDSTMADPPQLNFETLAQAHQTMDTEMANFANLPAVQGAEGIVQAIQNMSNTLNDNITNMDNNTNNRFNTIEGRLTAVEVRLGALEISVTNIDGRLTNVEHQVNQFGPPIDASNHNFARFCTTSLFVTALGSVMP